MRAIGSVISVCDPCRSRGDRQHSFSREETRGHSGVPAKTMVMPPEGVCERFGRPLPRVGEAKVQSVEGVSSPEHVLRSLTHVTKMCPVSQGSKLYHPGIGPTWTSE